MEYIDTQITAYPEQAQHLTQLRDLFKKKLWFQLSQKLLETIRIPFFLQGDHLLRLRQNFVSKFEKKLRPLDFVLFATATANTVSDADAALKILEETLKIAEDDQQAAVLAKIEILGNQIRSGKLEGANVQLDERKKDIDSNPNVVDSAIHSAYHRVSAQYYKIKNSASDFFQHSLLFLAYTPLEQLSKDEQVRLASDVGLAALLGDTVYNFGELLQHPVLESLQGTPNEWLADVLRVFNRGDIHAYEALSKQAGFASSPLASKAAFLEQKIRIMALIDVVFNRNSDDRILSFQEVSQACALPVQQVELLLMKSFSLKVMKGTIDEVEKRVHFKWVQPRVLDKTQIASMRDRLVDWSKKVHQTAQFVEANAADILHER